MIKMKRTAFFAIFILLFIAGATFAQGTLEDYQRAERFLWKGVDKHIFKTVVSPQWIEDSNQFWYRCDVREGKRFNLVNSDKKSKEDAFDHEKLAVSLSDFLGKEVKPFELPFDRFEYVDKMKSIKFKADTLTVLCDLKKYKCESVEAKKPENPLESKSPDGKWIAYIKDYNLWVRKVKNEEEFALTTDGESKRDYATSRLWSWMVCESDSSLTKDELSIDVVWSPDSKKLVTYRTDRRKTKKLWLHQSMPDSGYRAQVWSYERPLPGETDCTTLAYMIFDVKERKQIPVNLEPQSTVVAWGNPQWFDDSKRLYLQQYERGYRSLHLLEIDAETGSIHRIITETSATQVDVGKRDYRILEKRDEVVWMSERDGWSHLYLYELESGELKNRITEGTFVVRTIFDVDEKKKAVYFVASGREVDRDPYLTHLYRVKLDGSELTLLTPENGQHELSLSPDHKYFVDTFSRVDLPPAHVLRQLKDGKLIRTLEESDVTDLLATGWRYPEPFKVKARDGETDIYGVIFRPSTFDAANSYPIIDGTYSGPQAVRTPKSFRRGCRNADQPLSELGFIVITIDGLGTANRSKVFHDFSYRNLGDIGAEDHISGLQQLCEKYPYIDLNHVGIYGHSAGGYDAAHALLTHPEFYKVAVSSAGNHDHQMAKAWWPEHWMGFPVEDHYVAQSNLTLAKNLEGKLLLVHGDMDNNVNPASSLRFAGELIKANKDFDLLIIPNRSHGLSDHEYFIRKRWDYFVEHLLGVDPPNNYKIGTTDDDEK